MDRRKKRKKPDNRGAALVTVIVVVAFVSILATTFLYISGVNYFMKVTDQKTKVSFYEAEVALEEIKAELMELSSEAGKQAYMDVLVQYSAADGYTRYSVYQTGFFSKLQELWEAKKTADPTHTLTEEELLKSMVDSKYRDSLKLDISVTDAGKMDVSHAAEGYALLKGICLEYTDDDGYTTIISTDYLISVPEMNWSVDHSKDEWSEGGYSPEKLERETFVFTECVQYFNWVKK